MKQIIEESLKKSYSYNEYRELTKKLLSENKSTGEDNSEAILNYAKLNEKRMERLDKTISLEETTKNKLKEINKKYTWLLIAEGWCADAAQNVPIINKMAEVNDNFNLRIVLRDKNLELMDEFLTNGGRAIPVLLILDKENNVLSTWGSRPSEATKMVEDYKAKNGKIDDEFKKNLQIWYTKNKGKNLQGDLLKLL
ncbi:MAG: thioredoxin family protein [Tenacibaculum sp.]|nr:thioredoxin family protein [Tenacibaculum sp.]